MTEGQKAWDQDILRYLEPYKLDHSATGFPLLIDSINLLLNEENLLQKRRIMPVYNAVAEMKQCKFTRVERAIRLLLKKSNCGMVNSVFIFKAVDDMWLKKQENPP